jgi:hypothetical protein
MQRKQSFPAFLDLADSVRSNPSLFPFLLHADLFSFIKAARLGTHMPNMSAVRPFLLAAVLVSPFIFDNRFQRVELKRIDTVSSNE